MLKNKVLFKITASIAAYKSCYIISKLVQNGFEVKTIISPDALNFIGKASLEGLTGNKVYMDTFESGEMMSHINLVKWADLTIVAPATGNTINKMAAGNGDNLLLSLFLAHDWNKPYIIAPAMNTKMYLHPATQKSITTLKKWGVKFIEPVIGNLACGDEGVGKLAEPDLIYNTIIKNIVRTSTNEMGKKILVTAGGTQESIDGVRSISNMSSGKTASAIAEELIFRGYNVTFLHATNAETPTGDCKLLSFSSFTQLNDLLKSELKNCYDLVIHNAAVSDYSVSGLFADGQAIVGKESNKISSGHEKMTIELTRNFKIVDRIKSYSKNKSIKLVSFKLVNGITDLDKIDKVNQLLKNSNSDFVVLNDMIDREGGVQKNFHLYNELGKLTDAETPRELVIKLISNIEEEKKK